MTSRERLLKVIAGELPDCVPVAPDTSNMIPVKMTGAPYWDSYLYQDIPPWKAYINCVKHFGFDSLMDGYVNIRFEELGDIDRSWQDAIVFQDEERIVTRRYQKAATSILWSDYVTVYYRDNPPTYGLHHTKAKVDAIPSHFEDVQPRGQWPEGEALLALVKSEMGESGLVGVFCGSLSIIGSEEGIYHYYDDPDKYIALAQQRLVRAKTKLHKLMSLSLIHI